MRIDTPWLGVGVALVVLYGSACADQLAQDDSCAANPCITAPPPQCSGTIKTVFQALGTCTPDPSGASICDYPIAQQQDCALLGDKICTSGQCVKKPDDVLVPCGGVTCAERPAADCDGQTARIYQSIGTCNPDKPVGAQCEYEVEALLDCTETGFACREGGCINPALHPCDPNPCNIPPQGSCAGNTPTSVTQIGTCTEKTVDNRPVAQCAYPTSPAAACQAPTVECYVGRCARTLELPDAAGDLLINEVMKNPASQGDEAEWFELFNPNDAALQLDGCVVSDDGGESFTIGADVVIAAKGFLVFGSSVDPKPNGGFIPDYLYATFVLGNNADEITIRCDAVIIDRVLWTDQWPSGTGRSMTLGTGETATASGNDFLGAWCDASTPYGDGTNLGSPRRANPACPAP